MYSALVADQQVVVKRFDVTENTKQAIAAKQSFLQEATMMTNLLHPNLLPYALLFCVLCACCDNFSFLHLVGWPVFFGCVVLIASSRSWFGRCHRLLTVSTPDMCRLLGVSYTSLAYFIVTPLLRRGSLDKNLYVNDMYMPLSIRLNCLCCVARGLLHLHVSHCVFHHGIVDASYVVMLQCRTSPQP